MMSAGSLVQTKGVGCAFHSAMYVEQLVPLALTQRRAPKVRAAESGV